MLARFLRMWKRLKGSGLTHTACGGDVDPNCGMKLMAYTLIQVWEFCCA
jgi:hypothetical protein